MIIGVLLQTVTLIILTARTNWDAEVINLFSFRYLYIYQNFVLEFTRCFLLYSSRVLRLCSLCYFNEPTFPIKKKCKYQIWIAFDMFFYNVFVGCKSC
jgi:hypothetical protein